MRKILSLIFGFAFAFCFELDFNKGAVNNVSVLSEISKSELMLDTTWAVTGVDYEDGEFLFSTRSLELFKTDSEFKQKAYLKSTKDWIIQMEDGVSSCFYNGSVGIMSYNKTYTFFKHVPGQSDNDANLAWRYLYDGYKDFSLDFKDRYYTVRAKQQYILGWDHSKFHGEFFIATVPDNIKQSWSIASFSDSDNMLSSEFVPSFDEALDIKAGRDINDYYITGIDASDEFVYLLSKQYSSILKLDVKSRKIVEVFVFSGVADATGIAIKDGNFYITSRENGKNFIHIFAR
ncbi:hypothetical protein [Campylobacter majalis]|uniref:hypothetical protein n=1 Tax=Campylobacter majalis TaxID=2790656 RepID=UPI003D690CF5